jgi:hypothetical protein
MHLHDLYQVTDLSDLYEQGILDLTAQFITATNPPNEIRVRRAFAEKAKVLINATSESWRKQGVLVVDKWNKCGKSAEFRTVWNAAPEVFTLLPSPFEGASGTDIKNDWSMSRRSPAATRRGLSEDNLSGKVLQYL